MIDSRCAVTTMLILAMSGCSHTESYSKKILAYNGTPATASSSTVSTDDARDKTLDHSFPRGVIVADLSSGREVDGLYPGGPHDVTCCWLSRLATVKVDRNGTTSNLEATIFVPYEAFLFKNPEMLTLTVNRHRHVFSGLGPGVHKLSFVIDSSVKPGPFEMQIAGRGWIPAEKGINGDTRVLSVILNQIVVR